MGYRMIFTKIGYGIIFTKMGYRMIFTKVGYRMIFYEKPNISINFEIKLHIIFKYLSML